MSRRGIVSFPRACIHRAFGTGNTQLSLEMEDNTEQWPTCKIARNFDPTPKALQRIELVALDGNRGVEFRIQP